MVNKNRTLLIFFNFLGIGGIPRKIVDLINYLAIDRKDLSVYLILKETIILGPELTAEIKNPRAKIIKYENIPFWGHFPYFYTLFILLQILIYQPQVVLTFLSPLSLRLVLIKLLTGNSFRLILNEDHYTSGTLSAFKFPFLHMAGIRLLYQFADKIISPTLAAKYDLINRFQIPEKKVIVIPNWTRLADKTISHTKRKYDLIYTGRFVSQKNLKTIIYLTSVLKKYKKDISLVLLGEGREEDKLRKLVAKLNLNGNVIFPSPLLQIERYLAQSKILVHCSVFSGEGFPLAILEAMACETLVISSKFAGAGEVIENGENGILYRDFEDLVKNVIRLLQDDRTRKSICDSAKKYVKEHHHPRNISKYCELLQI